MVVVLITGGFNRLESYFFNPISNPFLLEEEKIPGGISRRIFSEMSFMSRVVRFRLRAAIIPGINLPLSLSYPVGWAPCTKIRNPHCRYSGTSGVYLPG